MLQQVQGVELHRVSITEIGNIHPKHNKSAVPSSGKRVFTLVLTLSGDYARASLSRKHQQLN